MATDDRWYFTPERIRDSPSRKCGIDADKELSYRQQAANLIQDMGQSLSVNQLCMNTAIVYMHRFYVFHSFTKFKWNEMAACCLFLAAKVEEQPRKLEHVIKVQHTCLHRDSSSLDVKLDQYLEIAQQMVINENILLQTLGFDVGIEQPNSHVVNCCELVRASRDLAQTSYFMATESLHLTTMCLQYKPAVVACVCIHLACKWGKWELPNSSQGMPWFWYVDKTVTVELLEELTSEFLGILEKSPNRLRRKLMSARKEALADYPYPPTKKDGHSSSSRSGESSKKDVRNQSDKVPRDPSGAPISNSVSAMSRTMKQNSPANHKKRIMPGDDKAAVNNNAVTVDSRPQKKQKVDVSEWKERREKEKMMQQRQKNAADPKMKPMPPGSGDARHPMPDKARYQHHHDKHRPIPGKEKPVGDHSRHDHKAVAGVQHRDKNMLENRPKQVPPYSKEWVNNDKYQMMKHLNQNLGSFSKEPKQPVKEEINRVKEQRPFQKLDTSDMHKYPSVNDLRKRDSVSRVPPQPRADEVRTKAPNSDVPYANALHSGNHDSTRISPNKVDSEPNSDQINTSDKLFDDLISASVPKSSAKNVLSADVPSVLSRDSIKHENSSINNYNKQLRTADVSSQRVKQEIKNELPLPVLLETIPTNGEKVSNTQPVPQRISPRKRLSSNSQKTPPGSVECRRSSRHKTPPITSPSIENKMFSPPIMDQAHAMNDNLQPVVKIKRIEVDKQQHYDTQTLDPTAPPKVEEDSLPVNNDKNVHNIESELPPAPPPPPTPPEIPKNHFSGIPDKNLDPEPMDIVPITKHSEKSRKERHERHKSSRKEKHRHKHSHSDSHRERSHGIKLLINKEKISKSEEKQRGSPSVESGGGLKLKISKGRLTDPSAETNDNSNSSFSSTGGLKLVISKSKLSNSGENPSNGNSSGKSDREHRRKDKSPRSQKSPKSSRSAYKSQQHPDEAAQMMESNFNQPPNPYFMPPVANINQQVGPYAYAQQYCPAPAAIHPATANTSVRPPTYPGYTMYDSSYQQQQPPLPSAPPPPPPPPPNK